ncbi:MAG TPA: hypothetical protein VN026_08890, partial [Bacteroidia bacterium]|nr:hypothetical protein [Bacteroidia bacterium]
MKKINSILLILFLLFISAKFYSQRTTNGSAVVDSLAGFNYLGAKEHADEMKTEKEKLFFMNHAKRTYKIAKYNLYPQKSQNGYSSNAKGIDASTYQGPQPAGCTNIDFESGNTSGWTVFGDNSIVAAGTDPYGGFPKVYPGGNYSLKLNDNNTSGSKTTFSASATRVIPVTASNSQFQLHFAFCILNFPHPANAAAIFKIYFLNASNTTVSCPQFSCYYATPPGTLVGMPAGVAQTSSVTGQNIGAQVYPVTYVPWQTVSMDLTPYIGQNLTAVIVCDWCLYNYDWGYCYIDADCAPVTPTTAAVCPGGQLCGPSGMSGYTWTPPSGPVVTTSCITTGPVGTYTLAYTPFATCGPSIQTNTYQVLAKPIAAFTTTNSCNSFTITNTGTGPPAVQSYSFAGPSPPATFTTTSATSPVTFLTAGNYTITQTITNSAGCSTTVQAVVVVPAGPNPAFTIPTPTQCLVGNSYVFTAVQPATTHTYNFNPVVGSPPVGTTNPYGPV